MECVQVNKDKLIYFSYYLLFSFGTEVLQVQTQVRFLHKLFADFSHDLLSELHYAACYIIHYIMQYITLHITLCRI